MASGTAIGAETLGWKQPVSAATVFDMAQQGDAQAGKVINRSAAAIAQMLADMKMALDLEVVILGAVSGWRLATWRGWLPPRRHYRVFTASPYKRHITVRIVDYSGRHCGPERRCDHDQ